MRYLLYRLRRWWNNRKWRVAKREAQLRLLEDQADYDLWRVDPDLALELGYRPKGHPLTPVSFEEASEHFRNALVGQQMQFNEAMIRQMQGQFLSPLEQLHMQQQNQAQGLLGGLRILP